MTVLECCRTFQRQHYRKPSNSLSDGGTTYNNRTKFDWHPSYVSKNICGADYQHNGNNDIQFVIMSNAINTSNNSIIDNDNVLYNDTGGAVVHTIDYYINRNISEIIKPINEPVQMITREVWVLIVSGISLCVFVVSWLVVILICKLLIKLMSDYKYDDTHPGNIIPRQSALMLQWALPSR